MNLNKRRGAYPQQDKHGFITLLLKAFLVFTISIIIFGYYYFLVVITPTNLRGNDNNGSRLLEKQQLNGKQQPIATIGYAVTVSGCPGKSVRGDFGAGISDGAAVLKHSIHLNSIQNEQSQSLYDYKMYALVHVDAESCARDALEPLGYEILLRLVYDVYVNLLFIYMTYYLTHSHNTSEMYQFH